MSISVPPQTVPPTGVIAFLQEQGRLSSQDRVRAEGLARQTGESEAVTLAHMGLISEADLVEALSAFYQVPAVKDVAEYPDEPAHDQPITFRYLREMKALPLAQREDRLEVAVADPGEASVAQALRLATGLDVQIKVGRLSEIESALERIYGSGRSALGEIVEDLDDDARLAEDIEHLKDLASEARSSPASRSWPGSTSPSSGCPRMGASH
ncbi:MAG: hypothetical protein P8171_08275 [Candidatus Thiodiazotropha sp.]